MSITIQFDGSIDIATGRSRHDANYRNKQITWVELVTKLSKTHRTAETYNEYIASKRERQDEIKDIGGFIGGYLVNGKRKAGSVLHRQLLTLDMDYGAKDIWGDFTLVYDSAAVIYSTHKHKPESPRFRLVIPLSREVSPDEFKAISRRVAGDLNIDSFDHTTSFKPSQIMYWPSTSKDGVYTFEYQDGPWVDADKILASYHNWKDASEWPISSRENTVIDKAIKKQGDPLEKPGIVGAFCRTYDIHQVIEKFLSDIYEPCDIANRYTFKEGSTSAGVIVYEDKFTYSHHGTDPASGKLCNAFDLVRLHLYGLRDEEVKETTPINKRPSFIAMNDFALEDPKVKKIVVREKLQSVVEDFNEDEPGEVESNDDWTLQMNADRKGNLLSTINNIVIMLQNDKALRGAIAFDEFESRMIAKKDLPWRKVTAATQDFTDDDDECLSHYLESKKVPFAYVQKALAKLRVENKFHPVRDYLSSLKWDNENRVENLFIDYLGSENSEYVKTVTRKTLVAAVTRIFKPGCKFDNALVLVGKQGIGKSTIISKLGRGWFSSNFGDVHSKECMENLRGVWIMEIGELAKLKNADVEAVKNFISNPEDNYRPAYGRKIARFPRQCIFIGSTNNSDFLRDATGNRRFWPVTTGQHKPTKDIFSELTDEEINQVWAEAVIYFKQNEGLDLPAKIKAIAETIQEAHTVDSGLKGIIVEYLERLFPENWDEMNLSQRRGFLHYDDPLESVGTTQKDVVCVAEIWCELFKKDKGDMNSFNTKDIHDVLRKLPGWEPTKSSRNFKIYGTQRAYQRSFALNAENDKMNAMNAKRTLSVHVKS